MLAKGRIITAAALLLHSIFGCGLHQACGCAIESAFAAASPDGIECCVGGPNVQHGHEHSKDLQGQAAADDQRCTSKQCGGAVRSEPLADDGLESVPLCCDQEPCEGHEQTGQCGVGCSFVPPTDVAFQVDAPFVEFVGRDDDALISQCNQIRMRRLGHWRLIAADDPASRCASLCTWQL